MRFLVDQNISWRVVRLIADAFPGSMHVDEVGLGGETPDIDIWQHAADNGFTILTKDSDFNGLALTRPTPPKVVWLQLGHASTKVIAATVLARKDDIEAFDTAEDESVLVVTA